MIKSLGYDQHEILRDISLLHNDGQPFECDVTYGNGSFYKDMPKPKHCFDIEALPDAIQASSTSLPLPDSSMQSVVFDPPFLTYVRKARTGNGRMIMSGRFSGYWRYDELEAHYKDSLTEIRRVLKHKGLLVFKCQDIIHNHRIHCTHANVIRWAEDRSLRLVDLFVLGAKHRLPSPNRNGTQRHARVYPSYFLVFRKLSR